MKNSGSQISSEYPFSMEESSAHVENESITVFNFIDFSDPTLQPWEALIKDRVKNHTKPDEINQAFIKLCLYIQQQLPLDCQSVEGKKIRTIINSVASNNEPLKLMDAILYIKQSELKISSQINFKLSALLRNYPEPLALAKATITMINFGLLDEEGDQTVSNFEQLILMAQLWLGNPALAEPFEKIYPKYFTQDNFNDLIRMIENQSNHPRNQARLISNILGYLNQLEEHGVALKRPAIPLPSIPKTEAMASRQSSNLRLFDKHYLVKPRSKAEDEQTEANIDEAQLKQSHCQK